MISNSNNNIIIITTTIIIIIIDDLALNTGFTKFHAFATNSDVGWGPSHTPLLMPEESVATWIQSDGDVHGKTAPETPRKQWFTAMALNSYKWKYNSYNSGYTSWHKA